MNRSEVSRSFSIISMIFNRVDISWNMVRNNQANWNRIRRVVYKRDNYRCQNCGTTDTELHLHHIVPLGQGGLNKKSNLETLCKQCHEAAYGRGQAMTGIGVDINIVSEPNPRGTGIGKCPECETTDFGYEGRDMMKCMQCDRVYHLEECYITDAVLESFEKCPVNLCNGRNFEYSPFYYEDGRARMKCETCMQPLIVNKNNGNWIPEKYKNSSLRRKIRRV